MATDLGLIDTIVILMMENRSFDHMLGYLSLPGYGDGYKSQSTILGLKNDPAWLAKVANPLKTTMVQPAPMTHAQIADPPHERVNVALQARRTQRGNLSAQRIRGQRRRAGRHVLPDARPGSDLQLSCA